MCSRAFVGRTAYISVSREGYILETIERTISNEARQIFQGIFIAPTLNEGELRLVLGWETTQDLDLYVEQMNKYDIMLFFSFLYLNLVSHRTKINIFLGKIPLGGA